MSKLAPSELAPSELAPSELAPSKLALSKHTMKSTLAGVALAAALALAAAAPAGAASDLLMSTRVGDTEVAKATTAKPVKLPGGKAVRVQVAATNQGSQPLTVASIRIESRLIGLTLFAYEAQVDLVLSPGQTTTRTFAVRLADLQRQVTGLVPARVVLLDSQGKALASDAFTAKVGGSLLSVYGLFFLTLAASTALLLAGLAYRLATNRLPADRWRRATRFGTAGVGLGLTLCLALSIIGAAVPTPTLWATVIISTTVILFGIGYLTPTPAAEPVPPSRLTNSGDATPGDPGTNPGDGSRTTVRRAGAPSPR